MLQYISTQKKYAGLHTTERKCTALNIRPRWQKWKLENLILKRILIVFLCEDSELVFKKKTNVRLHG